MPPVSQGGRSRWGIGMANSRNLLSRGKDREWMAMEQFDLSTMAISGLFPLSSVARLSLRDRAGTVGG